MTSTASEQLAPNPGTNFLTPSALPDEEPDDLLRAIASRLGGWADTPATRQRLGLDPELSVAVRGFHPVHRIAVSGELLVEMVAHFVQTQKELPGGVHDLGGLKFRAGVTLIANIDGHIRYVIRKPFDPTREASLLKWVAKFDEDLDPGWSLEERPPNRLVQAYSAQAMDRRRWR